MRQQCLDPALVVFLPLALEIRPVLSFAGARGVPADGSLIPIQPEPAQAIQDDIDGFLRVSRDIRVFDAENERAAGMSCIKPIEQSRPCPANVQEPCRTWRKSDPWFHQRHSNC